MTLDDASKEMITLRQEGVQIKYTERTRNRLKFQIKFKEDEAVAFKNYAKIFKDPALPMDDFIRVVFFTGMEALNEQVVAKVKAEMEENSKDLEKVGIEGAHDEVTKPKSVSSIPSIKPIESKNDSSEG